MRKPLAIFICLIFFDGVGLSAPKPHVVALGKWTTIAWRGQDGKSKPSDLKVRPVYVDGRTKEFTVGAAHDVTERTFVVQRIYRVNDSLSQKSGPTQWRWQRGGWLLIDRVSGKAQPIALPEFDPGESVVNWFRDYVAYGGTSDDGQKAFAIVVQLGRRKPLLKRAVKEINGEGPICASPVWGRHPVRVTFEPSSEQKLTFAVKSRSVDLLAKDNDAKEDDDGEE